MCALSGDVFKQKYGTTFYKMLNENEYHIGLNIYPGPVKSNGSRYNNGLCFTNIENLLKFLEDGKYIGIIEIPDNSEVYPEYDQIVETIFTMGTVEINQFRTNKLILKDLLLEEAQILNIIKRSYEHGCILQKGLCLYAAYHGYLEILKWARENNCPWHKATSSKSAANGHFELLKWAHENGCPWDALTSASIVRNGHYEILRWAHENGCPINKFTCAEIASRGDLEMLKWARHNGAEWDELTCIFAIGNGHLDLLKWATANGCPWNKWQRSRQARYCNRPEILKWISENGGPLLTTETYDDYF